LKLELVFLKSYYIEMCIPKIPRWSTFFG